MNERITLQRKELSFAISEEYKLLRTNIQFLGVNKRVLMTTSAISSEGKSTTTLNLSMCFTQLGKRVLLIDTDMRRSVLNKQVTDQNITVGLSHYLSGRAPLEDVLYHTDCEGLDIIFAGAVPPNPAELLASDAMKELLAYAKANYDYVFVDTAPLGLVVDAAVVAPQTDGAIILLEAGRISRRFAADLVQKLNRTGCPVLGVILNKVHISTRNRYYKGYYHSYYGKHENES